MQDLNNFRELIIQLKNNIKISYKTYYSVTEPNNFWRLIQSLQSNTSMPQNMTDTNGDLLFNPQNIADAFANFFQSSYTSPTHTPRVTNKINTNVDTINITIFTETEVLRALKTIKPKGIVRPDKIPAFLIFDCAHILAKPLAVLFNLSLERETFPDLWKTSKIVPGT